MVFLIENGSALQINSPAPGPPVRTGKAHSAVGGRTPAVYNAVGAPSAGRRGVKTIAGQVPVLLLFLFWFYLCACAGTVTALALWHLDK
jgi:hypothetical protein